jgi:hypothetical protein
MKKLRQSEFKDYVAVDRLTEDGIILKTTLYLTKGKPQTIMVFDHEENCFYKTRATFNGEVIECIDIDPESRTEGMRFEIQLSEIFNNIKC